MSFALQRSNDIVDVVRAADAACLFLSWFKWYLRPIDAVDVTCMPEH